MMQRAYDHVLKGDAEQARGSVAAFAGWAVENLRGGLLRKALEWVRVGADFLADFEHGPEQEGAKDESA